MVIELKTKTALKETVKGSDEELELKLSMHKQLTVRTTRSRKHAQQ